MTDSTDQTSTDEQTCRLPNCDRTRRSRGDDVDGFAARFCSTGCELKYEHLKADARDARMAAEHRRV